MSKRVVHFKPTAMRRDGVLCGKQVDEFTGRREFVTCKTCIAKARVPAVQHWLDQQGVVVDPDILYVVVKEALE